jgi:hypothetical protein
MVCRRARWCAGVEDRRKADAGGTPAAGQYPFGRGSEVAVVYYSRAPAWIRLSSGVVLQTGDHPRRYAATIGWMSLFAIGAGLYALRVGVRAGRGEHVWLRRATADTWPGVTGVLTLAGMFGTLGQMLDGGAFWPGVVGGLFGAAVGIVVSLG